MAMERMEKAKLVGERRYVANQLRETRKLERRIDPDAPFYTTHRSGKECLYRL